MKVFVFLTSLFLICHLSAQQKYSVQLTNIDKPEKIARFYQGDCIIIYYNDTSEISGIIKSIDQSTVVVDSVSVQVNQIQIVVDRKPKSGLFKLAGAGLVVGGVALVAGGMYFLVPGILSPSLASLYLIPAGLLADYFGITCIIRGINKLGNKGKQYDIGYQYKLEVFVK